MAQWFPLLKLSLMTWKIKLNLKLFYFNQQLLKILNVSVNLDFYALFLLNLLLEVLIRCVFMIRSESIFKFYLFDFALEHYFDGQPSVIQGPLAVLRIGVRINCLPVL